MKPNDCLLTSVHTNNFPAILKQLGISLIVSTYQAGKLIVIREDDGKINTHFRNFKKPMGLAGDREKLALGTAYQIWDFRNVPAVAAKLNPPGKHDACYLPRQIHITGNIDIHEMAWVDEELWFINTKFSCLCTLNNSNSFVPRWRPNFISGYDLTDRCHLNGFCLKNGKPMFATVEGIDKLMPPGEIGLSEFDVYLPLMSLPHVLGTTLATVPGEVPYLGNWELGMGSPPAPLIKGGVGRIGNEIKVGIVWAGSPSHKADRNRSCKLTDFLPVLRVPGVQFYSLQVGDRAADLKQLPPEITVEDLSPQIKNYGDTAAIVSQLALIISVDTSVAHLAGALGKPVWTLLYYNPDWRWMLEREDTRGYPTMRLFRQSQPRDWEGVFRRVERELLEFADKQKLIQK